MKKVTVNVTADDICNGIEQVCDRCPVALAIGRVVDKRKCNISVEDHVVLEDRTLPGGCYGHIELNYPSIVDAFIESFDHGQTVWPFEFEMEFPVRFLVEGLKSEVTESTNVNV